MDAAQRHKVWQYDGTNGAAMAAAWSDGYLDPHQENDGNLRLRTSWDDLVVITPEMYLCGGQIFANRAELDAAYYVLPEGS